MPHKRKSIMDVMVAVGSERKCPCGCNKLARPGDPGFGQRMTFDGKSGYWRRRCIERIRAAERADPELPDGGYPR